MPFMLADTRKNVSYQTVAARPAANRVLIPNVSLEKQCVRRQNRMSSGENWSICCQSCAVSP
nr:hypothetical protein SHINE37_42566 [Rhizobiaceae bacterium]